MVSMNYIVHLDKSGYAVVLREQPEMKIPHHEYLEHTDFRVDVPEFIDLDVSEVKGIWQSLYSPETSHYRWLDDALEDVASFASGSDRAYADLALRQAIHISPDRPRIYRAPEGGVVIESMLDNEMLTLLIENKIGILVRSSYDFKSMLSLTLHRIQSMNCSLDMLVNLNSSS